MEWISVKDRLPPAGHRVIATDGVFVGEAYITTVGGVSAWHRSMGYTWEAWSHSPVVGWMEMPDAWKGKDDETD